MTKRMQVYKCEKCGNIVEMLHGGSGVLICCDEPMKLFEEQTADASTEKHVPVIEKTDKGYIVKVGTIPHPMEAQHYIEWIELISGSNVYRKYLKPGSAPEAEFKVADLDDVSAREYCSIHGLWKG
ncbi:MAG: desulfoferrodoxin [Candidatus Aegiribacteria sp.]|nr:desulfoferrodoxin [Candidatus Aegiribacteria sp.]